jgi:hypothetical protein
MIEQPVAPVEYHRGLVSDKRRIGRGILAIALLIGGMQFFIYALAIIAVLVDTAIGTETRRDTPRSSTPSVRSPWPS